MYVKSPWDIYIRQVPASFTRTAKSLLGTLYTSESIDWDKFSPKYDAESVS